ncbi:hsp70 family protein [Puniceicoccaceae bacterium K14]|nr:hsp70 family protein [Puniceicoccaceae bacterium K14]
MPARYFIGIDLGTSNCALAYVDSNDPNAGTQIFKIPQFESSDTVQEKTTLPSFCYFLTDDENASFDNKEKETWSQETIVGAFARNQGAQTPERTISSAKSWLCHNGIDRESKLLPWQSKTIVGDRKRSPVEASAAYLDYLRFAWDQTIGTKDKQSLFERQDIVITVPASFDTIAQKLTLDAAEAANYPSNTRILEEPQAAFYAWLEKHPKLEQWSSSIKGIETSPKIALVCDIGGGTSDFSLFELSISEKESLPSVKRIAVSNHILLGGDNIDLALAHLAESKLQSGTQLSSQNWSQLTAQCRSIKEKVLSSDGQSDEIFTIALTGKGSSLFESTITVTLNRNEIFEIALEGFFPVCDCNAQPETKTTGLREIGLPYAQDSAITKHLADFIRQRKIDAILFNGGTLAAPKLQERLSKLITEWQSGEKPSLLKNDELDLAVARGAAWQQAALNRANAATIEAGAGHSFYLEVAYTPKRKRKSKKGTSETRYVCILPQGSPLEETSRLVDLELSLKVNTPIKFLSAMSTCRESDKAGELIAPNEHDFQKLPSLQTMAQLPPREDFTKDESIPIEIEARLNSLGILRVTCVSIRRIQGRIRRWQLEFNLRQSTHKTDSRNTADGGTQTNLSSETKATATTAIATAFKRSEQDHRQATGLLKQLEEITRLPRKEWSTQIIRSFWEEHSSALTSRDLSAEHELAWLNIAGFLLRPGYGHPLDVYNIKTLWFIEELDLAFPKQKAIREQYFLLWRRVAGGLDKNQQETLYNKWIEKTLQDTKQSYEPARMLGAFERIDTEKRIKLAKHFTNCIQNRKDTFADHAIWALGRLLSRVPLYGGEQAILPCSVVEESFNALREFDWNQTNLRNLPQMFVQSARVINHRDYDLASDLREKISEKIQASNAKPGTIDPLKEYVPIATKDIQQLFGESLPTGLSIG